MFLTFFFFLPPFPFFLCTFVIEYKHIKKKKKKRKKGFNATWIREHSFHIWINVKSRWILSHYFHNGFRNFSVEYLIQLWVETSVGTINTFIKKIKLTYFQRCLKSSKKNKFCKFVFKKTAFKKQKNVELLKYDNGSRWWTVEIIIRICN